MAFQDLLIMTFANCLKNVVSYFCYVLEQKKSSSVIFLKFFLQPLIWNIKISFLKIQFKSQIQHDLGNILIQNVKWKIRVMWFLCCFEVGLGFKILGYVSFSGITQGWVCWRINFLSITIHWYVPKWSNTSFKKYFDSYSTIWSSCHVH
jgi:hypothetical protein